MRTKKEMLLSLRALFEASSGELLLDCTNDEMLKFIDDSLEQLHKKQERTNNRAKEKRANDPLRESILKILTTQPQTISAIAIQIEEEYPDISNQKIIPRLTQLIGAGLVVKHFNTVVENGAKVRRTTYVLKQEEDE